MALVSSSAIPNHPVESSDDLYREELGGVDSALRCTLTSLVGWSLLWLVTGLGLALISAWKFHAPDFLNCASWLTLGRTYPASTNTLIYGWGFNAAFAMGIWLLSRLAGAAPTSSRLAGIAIWFWNLAIAVGIVGILLGDSSGVEWFEMPRYVTPVLLVCFAVIGSWCVTTLRDRAFRDIFISQWYVVAGLFWFAWISSATALMLIFFPVRGTVQAVMSAWYTEGLFSLWFGSVALAAIYYFLPKVSGRSVRYYSLSMLGFWSYGIFYSWLGMQRLIGGPVPIWVQAAGTATSLLALVPLIIISINLLPSVLRSFGTAKGSVTFKFISFGALSFSISGLQLVLTASGNSASQVYLSYLGHSEIYLSFLGFFSMTAFGALYYVVPRIARRPWKSAPLIHAHWIGSVVGVLLIYVALIVAGMKQEGSFADASIEMTRISSDIAGLLTVRFAGLAIFFLAQLAFAGNFLMTVVRLRQSEESELIFAEPARLEDAS